MEKPKNEWAQELAAIVNKAGYTVIEYHSISVELRQDGEEKEKYRTVIDLRLLPPQN